MSYPYVVYTPPYDPRSGGIKVLHRLVHELNQRGYDAYCTATPNPDWDEPSVPSSLPVQPIAVYPEIVPGNPFEVPTVARWVLNVPGRLGGDTEYDKSELIFPYKHVYNQWGFPNKRILFLPAIDIDVFYDRGLPRGGKAFFVGKGPAEFIPETEGLLEIDKWTNMTQEELAELLCTTELLYSYDNITALWDCARLCGCPVVIIPNGQVTEEEIWADELPRDGLGFGVEQTDMAISTVDSAAFREAYQNVYKGFEDRLQVFVTLTQARASFNEFMKDMK